MNSRMVHENPTINFCPCCSFGPILSQSFKSGPIWWKFTTRILIWLTQKEKCDLSSMIPQAGSRPHSVPGPQGPHRTPSGGQHINSWLLHWRKGIYYCDIVTQWRGKEIYLQSVNYSWQRPTGFYFKKFWVMYSSRSLYFFKVFFIIPFEPKNQHFTKSGEASKTSLISHSAIPHLKHPSYLTLSFLISSLMPVTARCPSSCQPV